MTKAIPSAEVVLAGVIWKLKSDVKLPMLRGWPYQAALASPPNPSLISRAVPLSLALPRMASGAPAKPVLKLKEPVEDPMEEEAEPRALCKKPEATAIAMIVREVSTATGPLQTAEPVVGG